MKEWLNPSVILAIIQLFAGVGIWIVSRDWRHLEERVTKIETALESARSRSSDKAGEQTVVIAGLQTAVAVLEREFKLSREDRGELRADLKDIVERLDRRSGEDRRV